MVPIRGEQQALVATFGDTPAGESAAERRSPFTKVVGFQIPQQFLIPRGVQLRAFVEDLNAKLTERGFVLDGRQIVRTPIAISGTPALPETVEIAADSPYWDIPLDSKTGIAREPDDVYEIAPRREWGPAQERAFSLTNPYQMGEEGEQYSTSHLYTVLEEPYLFDDERILALVHGITDRHYLYCDCHTADIVYTSRQRVVCMGCGGTHVVLLNALDVRPSARLTAEQWIEYFDEDGDSYDEAVELATVDFRDIENAPSIWETELWLSVKHRFIFFARSAPEEVAEAIRGTEMDPSIFLEAGFTPRPLPSPAALQLDPASIDVSQLENASHALGDGCEAFAEARREPSALLVAIPQLFRSIELLLKARLEALDESALNDRPNNPTVIQRLVAAGIQISDIELDVIRELRGLRNQLQHGESQFNLRQGLKLCREAITFADRFAWTELGLWIGDAIPTPTWQQILRIKAIRQTADEVVAGRLEEAKLSESAELSQCDRCGRETQLRPHPKTGASCLYCGHVAVKTAAETDPLEIDLE